MRGKTLVCAGQDGQDYIDVEGLHWRQDFRNGGDTICSVCNSTIKPMQIYYENHVTRNFRLCVRCVNIIPIHDAVKVYFAHSGIQDLIDDAKLRAVGPECGNALEYDTDHSDMGAYYRLYDCRHCSLPVTYEYKLGGITTNAEG